MNESYIQAGANILLGLMFFLLAVENLTLYTVLKRRDSQTTLGRAMRRKYASWFIAGLLLMALQGYSAYFNVTRESGWFTFEVRNGIRVLAVIGMGVVVFSMWQMYRELRKAEDEINSQSILEGEGD
jgi:hypothetical protein